MQLLSFYAPLKISEHLWFYVSRKVWRENNGLIRVNLERLFKKKSSYISCFVEEARQTWCDEVNICGWHFKNVTFFGRTNPYHGVQTILYKRCYDTFFYVEKLMTDSLVCDTETNSDYLDNTVDIVQKTLTSRDITGHVHIDSQLLSKFFSSFQVMLFELLFQEKGRAGVLDLA